MRPLLLAAALFLAGLQPARAEEPELLVGLYLPGVYFREVREKLELAGELAAHLQRALDQRAGSRVYATAEALESEQAQIALALVEAPYIASRLPAVTPLCVATSGGRDETRLVVLGVLPDVAALPRARLAYAQLARDERPFLDNFVFSGDLILGPHLLEPARDAASALAKISLRKAEAVLLYEGDAGHAAQARLKLLHATEPLPRPTLVTFAQRDPAQRERLREAMLRFAGRHPQFQGFRPASLERYQALHGRMQRRGQHLTPLLDLSRGAEERLPPLPRPAGGPLPQPPLRLYAPAVKVP